MSHPRENDKKKQNVMRQILKRQLDLLATRGGVVRGPKEALCPCCFKSGTNMLILEQIVLVTWLYLLHILMLPSTGAVKLYIVCW